MAKSMRSLRLPFVVTVGMTGAAACGGNIYVQGEESGGGGEGGSETTTVTSNGGGTVTVSTTSSTNPPACPPTLVDGYTSCEEYEGSFCSYDVSCQSGTVNLSFSCAGGYWQVEPQACEQPYDSCPGTELYCDGSWWMPNATNPPSPCPTTIPPAGTPCFPGGMGGVWEHCGYSCGGDPELSGWIIASCEGKDPNGPHSWQPEGACVD